MQWWKILAVIFSTNINFNYSLIYGRRPSNVTIFLHLSLIFFYSEPSIEPELKYVRIYFDTSTFDRIKKDRAAKFVDMLSAVGGTMGLLTGFSIISAAEIGYFLGKIIYKFMKTRKQFLN